MHNYYWQAFTKWWVQTDYIISFQQIFRETMGLWCDSLRMIRPAVAMCRRQAQICAQVCACAWADACRSVSVRACRQEVEEAGELPIDDLPPSPTLYTSTALTHEVEQAGGLLLDRFACPLDSVHVGGVTDTWSRAGGRTAARSLRLPPRHCTRLGRRTKR